MKPPAFQFYASDFLSSTSEMTAEEVGVHIRLLCHQWIKGGLPNDEARLATMAGQCSGNAVAYVRQRFSICQDGMLRHERLEAVRAQQQANSAKQREKADKRWSKYAAAHAAALPEHMPKGMPEPCSPTPTPILNTERPTVAVNGEGNGKPKATRERNSLFDALAELDGGTDGLTPTAAARVGTKLAGIRKATPDVTPEEIARRAANLRLLFPTVRATAASLEAHWAECDVVQPTLAGMDAHPDRLSVVHLGGVRTELRIKKEQMANCSDRHRPTLVAEIRDLQAKLDRHAATFPKPAPNPVPA